MKGLDIVSKIVKVLSVALVLTAILVFSVAGVALAHYGNGPGDGSGNYSDCPDDCGDCNDCTHEPHLYGRPGPHPPQD
jgi:hypothetical protein